jgi:hypothetical protein
MKKIYLAFPILLFFTLTSCKNIYYSGHSLEPGISFNGTSNASLDLYVDTTNLLKGSSTTKVTLGIFIKSDNVFSDAYMIGDEDFEKRAATYKALEHTNYDLIVLPKYRIETNKTLFTRSTTCYVEGYGGKYVLKNVKYINGKTSNSLSKNDNTNALNNTETKVESSNYKKQKNILINFMDEIELYKSFEIKDAFELKLNDIILTPNNSFGIVISNNGGSIKYLSNQSSEIFEEITDIYSNLKVMKK